MKDLQNKFQENWHKHAFHIGEQTILVAVSGGKDSMCLAHLMLQAGLKIALAHCNFQLRGTESDLDEQLVKNWAEEQNIQFHHIAFDTRKVMEKEQKGVQETARTLRYDWFQQLCTEYNYAAIATAHHANDNAETLLINLCKGTGIAGLHGIPAKNKNIIRPLLFADRNEIEEYVQLNRIPFREDESNTSTKYLRNAVRHKIIPALNEIFPEVSKRLNENIARFTQVETIYREAIEVKKKKLIEKRGADFYIPVLKLRKEKAAETICFELLSEFGFSPAQSSEITKLLNSESGKYLISGSHKVIRNRNFLVITELKTQNTDLILVEKSSENIATENGIFNFEHKVKPSEIITEPAFALIDADKIKFPLILRRWRMGDYFYPLGMGMKKKKVARFLIDQKVALHEKEKVWILESDQKIIWLAGRRLDERFKVRESTKNVVEIRYSEI